MISLSNLIKSNNYISIENKKKIEFRNTYINHNQQLNETEETEQNKDQENEEVLSQRNEILITAQALADEQIEKAKKEAAAIKAEAENEINSWWSDKRDQDEQIVHETKAKAVEQGIQEGTELATAQVKQQYTDMINEATSIVNTAYDQKEKIIQEAEPFLVELSCAIAERVIHKELHDSKEAVIHMISRVLTRRNEEGIIKCCVAPEQYKYVKDAREELSLSLDPQAELQIVPDSNLSGFDCVVHSSFGSIDAKIDTQLTEIKNQLKEITRKRDEQNG